MMPAVTDPLRVVLADDQPQIRDGLRRLLGAADGIEVVGTAPNGRIAVDLVRRTRPQVALLDIRMPELDGLAAAEAILDDPAVTTAVVILTTFDTDEYVYRALQLGVSGYVLKDAPAEMLTGAIAVAAAGDAMIAPSITRRLISDFARAAGRRRTVPDGFADLTERELDVLRLVARGLSNAEIAAALVISENTVKSHVARMLSKLDLRDRTQAVVLAYECGFAGAGT